MKMTTLNTILRLGVSLSLTVSFTAQAKTEKQKTVKIEHKLSDLQREARLQHAQELLGKYYSRSTVKSGERIKKINGRIYNWVKERLPSKHRHKYKEVAQAVIDESVKYELDPVLILSVIQGESSFNPDRLGKLDEIGLMQLRPGTAEWISNKYGLKWTGAKMLFDPVANVRIGAAYIQYLREHFDSHARLYLAAYNMGPRNVGQAREKKIWPKDYAQHVMRYYVDFYSEIDSSRASSI